MSRVFLSLLLIVNLLACPLRCAALSAADPIVDESVQPACSCCTQQCDLPASNVPVDNPEQECQCQNCICKGATLQDTPKLPDSTTVVSFMIAASMMKHFDNEDLSKIGPGDRHLVLSGRSMRITLRSLLN